MRPYYSFQNCENSTPVIAIVTWSLVRGDFGRSVSGIQTTGVTTSRTNILYQAISRVEPLVIFRQPTGDQADKVQHSRSRQPCLLPKKNEGVGEYVTPCELPITYTIPNSINEYRIIAMRISGGKQLDFAREHRRTFVPSNILKTQLKFRSINYSTEGHSYATEKRIALL